MYFFFAFVFFLLLFFDVAYFVRIFISGIFYGLHGRFSKRSILDEITLQSICLTTDLDSNWHMNNSRYLRECDFGRIKFFLESGIYKGILNLKASIVNAGNSIRYRKSIELFDFFKIKNKIVYWDEMAFYMEQQIVRNKDGFVCAINTVKMTVKGTTPSNILRVVAGRDVTVPNLTPELQYLVESWRLSSDRLRRKT